jgi:hypothetical protein
MIKEALKYLVNEFNRMVLADHNKMFADSEIFVLENISRIDAATGTPAADNQKKVFVTLVNIEEEKTLKNDPFYIRTNSASKGDQIEKRNPTLFVNLYVLISCADDYENALDYIGWTITYLQGKNVFTSDTADAADKYPDGVEKIIMDLFTLNFDQINNLWGVLGGKYLPSALYKIRLLPIQAGKTQLVGRIEEVKADSNTKN